jgi:hypothetical protein
LGPLVFAQILPSRKRNDAGQPPVWDAAWRSPTMLPSLAGEDRAIAKLSLSLEPGHSVPKWVGLAIIVIALSSVARQNNSGLH